jgi:hypothetical protein
MKLNETIFQIQITPEVKTAILTLKKIANTADESNIGADFCMRHYYIATANLIAALKQKTIEL